MVLQVILPTVERINGTFYILRTHISKESQAPHVHTHDRNTLVPYEMGRLQQRTVTSHRDDEVSIEVIPFEHPRHLNIQMLSFCDEVVKLLLHIHICLPLGEIREYFLDAGRLLCLIHIAKDGEPQFLLSFFSHP